jgi:hypothetical protein
VSSLGSPLQSSVEQHEPSNGQSATTLIQVPNVTKLSATPSTDYIVCSPSESHSYLRKDHDNLDLSVDGRVKKN